jgi:hypothetical protein
MTSLRSLGLVPALFLASCAAPPDKQFYISAIDNQQKELRCVILKDNQVLRDKATNEPILTPSSIPINFKPSPEEPTGFEPQKLKIRAVVLSPEGKILRGIQKADESPYYEEERFIQPNDARRQLFILRRNLSVSLE